MPIVAVDSDLLSLILNPALDPPQDAKRWSPVVNVAERLEYWIADLRKRRRA
jgi:hypothetical protein